MFNQYLKTSIIYLGLCFSLLACNNKHDRIVKNAFESSREDVEERKNKVLKTGDGGAYDALGTDYLREKHYEEYLAYSLYMANKYNYPRAYYYVYHCITLMYEKNHILIDEKSKEMALTYLKKGVALKESNSLGEYGELLMEGKYVKKDSILGKELFEEAWK